ncbi:MAG: hypothetical protein FWF26_00270, partial [Treponema sp.]|nr:hypothetical protein [Treponema sp.]
TGKNPNGFLLGKLPVSTSEGQSTPDDYLFTLMAGKNIVIDTTAPKLKSLVKNVKDGWYGKDNYLYFTATFDKPILVGTGDNKPALAMKLKKKGGSDFIRTDDVQINGTQAIFSYQVKQDDYTPGAGDTQTSPVYGGYLSIIGLEGTITDLAQNPYTPVAGADFPINFSGGTPGSIQVKAVKPLTPTLRVKSSNSTPPAYPAVDPYLIGSSGGDSYTWNPLNYADSDTFNAAFPEESANIVRLKNLYIDKLFIQIIPAGTPGMDYQRIEYSVNYGKDWAAYTLASPDTPKEQTAPGHYDLSARQIDMAGNVSDWSKPVTLNWDKGDLLARVSSASANGIYTNNTAIKGERVDTIPITLYFRKPVTLKANPKFQLNAKNTVTDLKWQKIIPLASYNSPVTEFTFDYEVGQYDSTDGAPLDLDEILSIQAIDLDGVDVSNLINLSLATANKTLLKDLKNIIIQTGSPKRLLEPYFYNDTTRPNNMVQSSPNFQGVKDEDDSCWITLGIQFDRDIFKSGAQLYDGSAYTIPNKILITQLPEGYRIPAVLTQTQWSRYKDIPNIENYYTKGTNGYRNEIGADTSTKYILNFDIDPYSFEAKEVPASGPDNRTDDQKFAEAFRQAERVELPINSSFIEISNTGNGNWVFIRLNGSNALKVPGAKYAIEYPAGFVQDLIGNYCEAYPPAAVGGESGSMTPDEWYGIKKVPGVSRPFIRISPEAEKITESNPGTGAQPRLVAVRPGMASLRLDTRTPASEVRYVKAEANTTGIKTDETADWTTASTSATYGPSSDPQFSPSTTEPDATSSSFGNPDLTPKAVVSLTIGPDVKANNLYEGYKLRIRAKGAVGTALSSATSEEVVYRSVLTFKASNAANISAITFDPGDQVWVRGGDTLYGATIPGFPLSSHDNFYDLESTGKRAGIRLMTRTNTDTTTALESSTWQWVSWEIKTITFIGLFKGHDTASTAAQAYQYGPLQAFSQTGNWSMAKDVYALLPGGHRWLNSQAPDYTHYKGSNTPPFTWVSAPEQRPPNYDAGDAPEGINVTTPIPWQ